MATVAIGPARATCVARATTDRALLRAFLERDRLYAAYAICDLEEREFARTRWGVAWDGRRAGRRWSSSTPARPAAAVRDGPAGRHRGDPARRHPAARGVRRRAARTLLGAVEAPLPRRPGRRRWSGCGSTGPASGRTRPTVQRLLPVEIGELNRLYQLGFASWLPAGGHRRRRLLRRCASTAGWSPRPAPTSISPSARLAVVGNVLTHVDYPWPRLRDRRDRRGDRRAAAARATRSSSTSEPTTRRRSTPIAASATPSTSASRSASSTASARPGPTSRRRSAACFARKETDHR